MEFDKHFGKRQEEKHLTTILVGKFDARDEMDRAVRTLELTMIKPMQSQSNLIRKPEEEARIAKQQYDKTLAQIDLAQQRYMERLEQAKKEGVVENDDYNGARIDVSSPHSSFGRMRDKAREAYREVVKFG